MDVPDALIRILALAPAGLVPLAARGPGRPPLPDTPEVALRSAERRRILEAVRETPGIHVRLLKRTLDMGGGEFDRNVERLVSAGLLEKHRIASHARLYPAGGAPPADLEPLEGAGARRAARIVVDRPGVTSAEVAEAIGVSERHARRWLQTLADAGLARAARKGLRRTYAPTARLRAAMERHPSTPDRNGPKN